MDAASYSARDMLRDGTAVEIRALRPADRVQMEEALGRMSSESLVYRFFAPRSGFSEEEFARFLDIDFVRHVALVAVMDDEGQHRIAGGARYVVVAPGRAEMACAVEDQHQGRGLGTLLLRHLSVLARAGGVREVIAEVMQDNQRMQNLLGAAQVTVDRERDPDFLHYTLHLTPP